MGIILSMIDPKKELLSTVVVAAITRLDEEPGNAEPWTEMKSACALFEDEDAELAQAIDEQDLEQLRQIAEQWAAGKRILPLSDRGVLKRAMKAFRKSLKVTRLAHDSKLGGGPLSGGNDSEIVGIQPPPRYPTPVWRELARQGRLVADHIGTYELPPGE
ncbi:MAG: hypothetical protein ACI8X5_000547 [Planctomycetota bacterium]